MLLPPEWQTTWRRRMRQSPPRHYADMEALIARWRDEQVPIMHLRILERDRSRYIYIQHHDPTAPIRPVDLELRLRNMFPRNRGQRYVFIDANAFVCRHDEPLDLRRLAGLTAYPAADLGANSVSEDLSHIQRAHQEVRRAWPALVNGKVLRTILRSQPQVARRIINCNGDAERIRILTVSAMQRAGLGALVAPSSMAGVTEKRGQQPLPSGLERAQHKSASSPLVPAPAPCPLP